MKNPIVPLLMCLLLVPLVVRAQGEPGWNKTSLGVNFELSVPTGDFSNLAGMGYGGNARFQVGMDSRAVFTATAGYLVWSRKDLSQNTSVQPKAFNFFIGGKYYVAGGFYGSLEGGLYFLSYTYEGSVLQSNPSTTRFMLPIGIGFQKSGFELGVRYMVFEVNYNSFSFTLGYNFQL